MSFKSVTVFILANTETDSLHEVIRVLQKTCDDEDIDKFIVVLKSKDCPAYAETVKIINEYQNPKLCLYVQKASDLPSCINELPGLVKGSHFIIMASDMEMDPYRVKNLIFEAKKLPDSVICASKWHKESTVEGYGFWHKIATKTFNKIVSLIFLSDAKDPVSIFRIYPMNVYNKIKLSNPNADSYDYTLFPLGKKNGYKEIPTYYRKRTESKSNFNFIFLFRIAIKCIFIAFRIRLKYSFER